jgi:hypothetical protein
MTPDEPLGASQLGVDAMNGNFPRRYPLTSGRMLPTVVVAVVLAVGALPAVGPAAARPTVVALDASAAGPAQSGPAPRAPATKAGPSNTGVPPGTRLRRHVGDIDVTRPGTVIDGLDVRGAIKVMAPNVTIKNTIIRFRRGGYTDGIHSYSTGLRVIDTEIAPRVPSSDYNGIMGSGFVATRVDIHGVVDAVHIYGDQVLVRRSWLHGNSHFVHDPNWDGRPSHDDSIQIVGGDHIRIRRNTLGGAYNAGVQITEDYSTVTDVAITGNLAGGGSCTVNVSQKGGGPIPGLRITDNRFRHTQRIRGCAIIRPRTTRIASARNTWVRSGARVALRNGA